MQKQYSLQNKVFFYSLLIVLAGLSLWLASGYMDIIVFSLVMVILLKPVYDFFARLLKGHAGLATTATIIALFLAIIIPGWLILNVISSQVGAIIQSYGAESGQPPTLEAIQGEINDLTGKIPYGNSLHVTDEQMTQLGQVALRVAAWFGQIIVNLGMSIPSLMARLFIFLAIVGVLLPNYDSFVQRLVALSPLDDEVDRLFLTKIKSMVWSMFVGIVVIALAQGLITGLFFWLGDVPYTALWTIVAIVASSLPLGASLVAIPIAIYQLIVNNPVSSLIILGGYILIVSNVDGILRPKLVSKEAYLDAALVLVASLGGYDLFGFFGVIYGPVLMVLLLTAIEVYGKYYAPPPKAVVVESAEPESLAMSGQVVTPDG